MNPPMNSSMSQPDMSVRPVTAPEVQVVPPVGPEQGPLQPPSIELGQQDRPEQLPQNNPQMTPPAQQSTVPVVNASVQATDVHTDSATARKIHSQSIASLEAEDSELIEKPWVDKVEQVIETNKDNPFEEDEHQNELSRAYLKKRFNLDVK